MDSCHQALAKIVIAPAPNLLDLSRSALADWLVERGEKSFRAQQIIRWLHQERVLDFDGMSNLSKAFRADLKSACQLDLPTFSQEHCSLDGTIKWTTRLSGNAEVETVYIPENKRGTLCISSQVGCILDCSFCSTGKQGFNRNLTTAEIIGQLWLANQRLHTLHPQRIHPITNIVMMGMGEPLLNERHLYPALSLMLDDFAYALSRYRVTVSTSGILPAMLRLKEQSPVALAVSLHAADDELRNELVPINQKYPLNELLSVCQHYFEKTPRRAVVFEYVMLDGVNDTPQDVKALIQRLRPIHCKVNLIPFNPFPNSPYRTSAKATILHFQNALNQAGIRTTIRKTRGDDITAACGQLVGQVADKTRRTSQ